MYNTNKTTLPSYLKDIDKELDSLSPQYGNIALLRDFDCELKEETLSIFCEVYNLKILIKEPIYFKNPEKPTMIDLILTNKPKCFQHSCVYETDISDFDKMTIKQKTKTIFYRNYKR